MLPDRLLLTAEAAGGDPPIGAGGPGAPPATPPAAPAAANGDQPAWYAPAETLKTSDPAIWESFEKGVKSGNHKDFPTFVKHYSELEKKLGTSLTLPDKANADQVKDFKSKLVKGGVDLKALASEAPESPDKYEINLDAIPEQMRGPAVVDALRNWAHKKGLNNADVAELVAIESERYKAVVEPALKYTREQADQAINDFAKDVGKEPEEVKRWAGAWLRKHFSEEEVAAMDKQGFANSPVALKYAMRAGLDTGEDISVIDGTAGATDTEYDDLMKNLGDPNHADYKLFMAQGVDPQDPKRQAFMQKREQILQRKFGTGEVK